MALRVLLEEARQAGEADTTAASDWLKEWYAERALGELIAYRDRIATLDAPAREVAQIILSRSARSARLTTHFDLDFPRHPMKHPYHCHKHKRTCRPVDEAAKFLRRYTADTILRLRSFAAVQTTSSVTVRHADSRSIRLPSKITGVITSPPYPGLIDYHEQHRYAYELLGLADRRLDELGAAAQGTSRSAIESYVSGIAGALSNARDQLRGRGPVVIVVNDSRDLYPEILRRSGLVREQRLTRHVNRRTGRRAGEFYEDVLVCAADA
jgi:hypothetical protein